ncbi:MAG: DUF1735 and LamG domain-containing protein [Porphyromonas sp.]|nr:DUF1735 and LamG domain-containing protein [Porphyromonas sp.]
MQFINKYACIALSLFSLVACEGEQKLETFDNKGYIQGTGMVSETVIKGNSEAAISKSFGVSLARPASEDIKVTYKVDAAKVSTYNKTYYAQAELLPEECYTLPEARTATILRGLTSSTPITLEFKGLAALDRSKQYVLPVSIQADKVELLSSASVYYYVFRAGALINVVADIENNHLEITWNNPEPLRSMEKLTMEALIRVRNFDQMISTVMGIEGQFLMRIGDANFNPNQIQIATNNGNFPSKDDTKTLPTNQWVHVALTYDSTNGEMIVYVDGKLQSKGTKNVGRVSLASNSFQIGRSYADDRDLNGEISEARIWNVVRTQEEIANNFYSVDPASEGLVAYWKFDDEGTRTVKDHTANGNHATAKRGDLKWAPVSLPVVK